MSTIPIKTGVASDGRPMHYSVGAIIEDELGRFLLLDRKYEPYGYAGMAGHVDDGEDHLTALLREGREEIGVTLSNPTFLCEEEVLWNACYRGPTHYWYLYRAKVTAADVKVDPHEAKRWGWFTKEQLLTINLEPVWKHWFILEGVLEK